MRRSGYERFVTIVKKPTLLTARYNGLPGFTSERLGKEDQSHNLIGELVVYRIKEALKHW